MLGNNFWEITMKLDLVWTAQFSDSIVQQFDNVETQEGEHRFKEVLERQDKLVNFSLFNQKSWRAYEVDLVNGRIYIRTLKAELKSAEFTPPESEVSGDKKYEYRLIYFRRVTQQMTWNGKTTSDKGITDIQYFLGFQYTNEKEENVKRLLQISKDDEVYIA